MVKKAKKVLIIKRRKRRRNEGKILPIKPELMKKPELNVLIYKIQELWKDDVKLMSQYENVGLVKSFKKLKEDTLTKQTEDANENVIEEDKEDINEEEDKTQKKSILRELVEKEFPQVDIERIPKIKEWEVPIVKRLIKKHKDNYKVIKK